MVNFGLGFPTVPVKSLTRPIMQTQSTANNSHNLIRRQLGLKKRNLSDTRKFTVDAWWAYGELRLATFFAKTILNFPPYANSHMPVLDEASL